MDSKITRRSPQQGFCAETGGAPTPFMAAQIGVPLSTTDTMTGDVFHGPAR
jgi:PiT family inorganic phosphate transporter